MPSGPSLKVTHYQFKGWPDHSVPECAGELLSLINRIGATDSITEGAILVHCRYRYSGSHLKCSVYVLAVEYRKTRAHTFTPISRSAINPYLHGFCNCTVHRYCLRHFVYVIGGSVVLFGKNRVLKLAVVNKIVRA